MQGQGREPPTIGSGLEPRGWCVRGVMDEESRLALCAAEAHVGLDHELCEVVEEGRLSEDVTRVHGAGVDRRGLARHLIDEVFGEHHLGCHVERHDHDALLALALDDRLRRLRILPDVELGGGRDIAMHVEGASHDDDVAGQHHDAWLVRLCIVQVGVRPDHQEHQLAWVLEERLRQRLI